MLGEALHRHYPGPTVVEANSIGLPLIQNLHLPESELIAHTTTQASKQQMLTAIELLLQQQTLKIHPDFQQLLAELADYRLPDSSITQDSVMALGFAVTNADHAHAVSSGGDNVLDLEPFSSDWYDWYADRRLRSQIDILNDNDARRGIVPPRERRARARAPPTLPQQVACRPAPGAPSTDEEQVYNESTRTQERASRRTRDEQQADARALRKSCRLETRPNRE